METRTSVSRAQETKRTLKSTLPAKSRAGFLRTVRTYCCRTHQGDPYGSEVSSPVSAKTPWWQSTPCRESFGCPRGRADLGGTAGTGHHQDGTDGPQRRHPPALGPPGRCRRCEQVHRLTRQRCQKGRRTRTAEGSHDKESGPRCRRSGQKSRTPVPVHHRKVRDVLRRYFRRDNRMAKTSPCGNTETEMNQEHAQCCAGNRSAPAHRQSDQKSFRAVVGSGTEVALKPRGPVITFHPVGKSWTQ